MSLVCPQCNAAVTANAIHYPTKTAQCPECGYQFSVARLLQAEEERKNTEIPLPRRMSKYMEGETLFITQVSNRLEGFLYLLIIVGTYPILYVHILPRLSLFHFFLVLTSIMTLAIGARLIYDIVTTTTISVTAEYIRIKDHPLPARNLSFLSKSVQQLYVRTDRTGRNPVFSVMLIMDTGTHETLLHLNKIEQAQFIEQEIKSHLGLEDAPVGDEYTLKEGRADKAIRFIGNLIVQEKDIKRKN
jgi:hypothetical protein